jgi:hypothetical protein
VAKKEEPAVDAAVSARSRDREERSRDDAVLPVSTLREAAPYLRRPFTPEAVRFKVQTVFGGNTGCLIVAYIDARLVIERLNRVIPDGWSAENVRLPDAPKLLVCRLTVDGVTREDVGESPKGLSKDLYSDALKRAAVQFGVGVSVYALPQIALYMNDSRGRIEVRGKQKQTIALTEHGHMKLREGYARWLEDHGVARFGEPLDHGDVEGAVFEGDEPEAEEFTPEPPAALDDDEATALVDSIKVVYDRIRALGDGAVKELPPRTFNAWLTGAQHSHEELRRLLTHLEERRPVMAEKYGGAA